ncbi:dihydrodipicolinate synthase family protein, partial [Gluconobacter roseus]
GVFDPLAPLAAYAVSKLGEGDNAAFHAALDPTVPLARVIFKAPTQYYKTGVVFLAWLNGFQDHFIMLGGAQSMRPLPYFTEIFRLADGCGLFRNPELAVRRMKSLLSLYGAD